MQISVTLPFLLPLLPYQTFFFLCSAVTWDSDRLEGRLFLS